MPFLKSRIAIALVISAVSLGAAYAALQTFSDNSHESPATTLVTELNDGFATRWKARTGVDISVRQARNKAGTPVRAVHDGLGVATLALYYDRDKLREKKPFYCSCLGSRCASTGSRIRPAGVPLYINNRIPRAQGKPQGGL